MALLTLVDLDGPGAHPALWTGYDGVGGAREVAAGARSAERAGFTAAVFADHPLHSAAPGGRGGRPDGLLRAAFAAPLTGAIGLIPVVAALVNEPFHVSTQLASLDIASGGRAGWIVEGDPDPRVAARYGRPPLSAEEAEGELVDVVEAVRRLWDSWEDDAVIRDASTGRYLDRDRLHPVDFVGRRFSVQGPAIVPRPTQGQPIVVGAVDTAAEVDAVLVDARDAEVIAERAAEARARHGDGVRVLARLEVVLDAAGATGAERLARLDATTAWQTGRARHVGTADGLVELLARIAPALDGVRFVPAETAVDLEELGRAVLPALRARGLARSPRAGDTARDTWGLPRPANRFVEGAR